MAFDQILSLAAEGWVLLVNWSVMAFIAYCLIEVLLKIVKPAGLFGYFLVAGAAWILLTIAVVLFTVPIEKGRFFGYLASAFWESGKPFLDRSIVLWLPAIVLAVFAKLFLRKSRKLESERKTE